MNKCPGAVKCPLTHMVTQRSSCYCPAVPLAERAPPLGGALYEAMLRALVPHVSLPQHFTSWEEEGEVDQDAFDRLRWAAVVGDTGGGGGGEEGAASL